MTNEIYAAPHALRIRDDMVSWGSLNGCLLSTTTDPGNNCIPDPGHSGCRALWEFFFFFLRNTLGIPSKARFVGRSAFLTGGRDARGLYKSHRPQRPHCFILRFGIWNSTGPVTPIWRYAVCLLFSCNKLIFAFLDWRVTYFICYSSLPSFDLQVNTWIGRWICIPLTSFFECVFFSSFFSFNFVVFFIKLSNWRAKIFKFI